MELRNRVLPIFKGTYGADRQRAALVRALAPDERSRDEGKVGPQHLDADFIPILGLASRLHASPGSRGGGHRRLRPRARLSQFSRSIDLTDGRLAQAQRTPPKTMLEREFSHLAFASVR